MRNRLPAGLLILALCLVMASGSREQAPAAGTTTTANSKAITTGQTIGTIVSTAFNAAFPIIGKVMDLFKREPAPATATVPVSGKKANKNTTTPPPAQEKTATESEVQAAVTKAQSDAQKAFKEKMQPTATVAKELGVIEIFGESVPKATLNLVAIKRMMAASKPDYSKIETEWKKFNLQMADVLAVSKADIDLVQEVSIKRQLLALQATRKDLMQDITDNIDRASSSKPDFSEAELQDQISAMASILNGFDSLLAAELGVLQSDIQNVSIWANSPQGETTFETKPADTGLISIAADAVQESKSAQRKHN